MMNGRPITAEELDRMLTKIPSVVEKHANDSCGSACGVSGGRAC